MASLPNRFLALVPWGQDRQAAQKTADSCRDAITRAWQQLAEAVHDRLQTWLSKHCPNVATDWDVRWPDQIEGFFDIQLSMLPRRQASFAAMAQLWGDRLAEEVYPEAQPLWPANADASNGTCLPGLWQAQVELAERLAQARGAVRHLPPSASAKGQTPPQVQSHGQL